MGTRSGSIDPSIIPYIMERTGMSVTEVNDALNKKSGLLGISGVSNDARDIWTAVDSGNHRALLAMQVLTHYIKKIVGSYVAEMNGMDVLVFTAGLGENDRPVREMVCDEMEFLGVRFDKEVNNTCPRGECALLSTPDSPVKVVVIPTDEEYMIAGDTYRLLQQK